MLALALGLALASPPPPPIVNGTATDDYPQAVMLRHATPDWRTVYICTGTLIAPDWVLTAAHCLTDPENEGLTELDVYMGTVWASGAPEQAADDWFAHPDYSVSADGMTIVADLGLVHVPRPYDIDGNVLNAAPITDADIGTAYRYVGWGSSGDYANDAGYDKRYADIPLVGLEGEFILGYDPGGGATCGGDSGGPVFELDGGRVGALIAVHSFGRDDDNTTCAGSTSGDTRVDLYLEWIASEVDVTTNADTDPSDSGDPADSGGDSGGGDLDSRPPRDDADDAGSKGGCATVKAPGTTSAGWLLIAAAALGCRRGQFNPDSPGAGGIRPQSGGAAPPGRASCVAGG